MSASGMFLKGGDGQGAETRIVSQRQCFKDQSEPRDTVVVGKQVFNSLGVDKCPVE